MIATLRYRASLKAKTLTPDGGGGYSESWDTVALVWCAIEPLSGDDVLSADRLESRIRHRLLVRRGTNASAGNRMVVGDRIFAVHAVLDEGAHAALLALACEEIPQGDGT